MKTLTLMLAAAGCLVATTARADQCAWTDEAQATKAKAILAKSGKVLEYCEPCGDQAPGEPYAAREVAITSPETGYREVVINGKPVDLAYVFVKTSATKYKNLAKLAGCPATDVSASLTIADETPTAVVISPTRDVPPDPQTQPVPPPIPNLMQLVPPAPPPSPPVAMNYFYNTTVEPEVSWAVVALAGFGGFLAGAVTTFGAMTFRRRRAMRPRATDLVS